MSRPKPRKERLDTLLVSRELCPSRNVAQRLIRAGEVKVNQNRIDKPGTLIPCDAEIELAKKPPFVSRGGEKLAQALQAFEITVTQRVCLDGGISTGGFTDCLLQAGASQVYGIDVGYGQVAWSLRQDPRVILWERTNFRHLTASRLYGETPTSHWATLGVMDVSFISLTKLLPTLWQLLASPKEVVLLVKPQFEVGRDKIGKKGVVRDPKIQAEAIQQVWQSAQIIGWQFQGLTASPITGPAGNHEFLLWLTDVSQKPSVTWETMLQVTSHVLTKNPSDSDNQS